MHSKRRGVEISIRQLVTTYQRVTTTCLPPLLSYYHHHEFFDHPLPYVYTRRRHVHNTTESVRRLLTNSHPKACKGRRKNSLPITRPATSQCTGFSAVSKPTQASTVCHSSSVVFMLSPRSLTRLLAVLEVVDSVQRQRSEPSFFRPVLHQAHDMTAPVRRHPGCHTCIAACAVVAIAQQQGRSIGAPKNPARGIWCQLLD